MTIHPKIILIMMIVIMVTGCSLGTKMGVKPWQRGTLAKDTMQLSHSSLQSGFDDHVYYAREASTGGSGSDGGGCGCN